MIRSSPVGPREPLQELTDAVGSAARKLMDRGLPLGDAVSAFESRYVREAVRRSHGNLSQAAAKLGIHRNTLRSKLQRNGDRPD